MRPRVWLWLLAGPNGAGKSTAARELLPAVEHVINPDDIAMRMCPELPEKAAFRAAREAVRATLSMIESRVSFARETTLAGHTVINLLHRAKTRGYRIGMIYIGLKSPDLAIARVRQRHRKGGHFVPARDVRRRYEKGLGNLLTAAQAADRVIFLDNSSSRKPAIRVLETISGRTIYSRKRLPDWLRRGLRIGRHQMLQGASKRR
jgi:predicted ABC-type ATPase